MSTRPNLILIMCDQWRPDCLGVLGHPLVQTPNLDALATTGALFTNAYCASPVCSPARGSWLTGLLPHAHGQLVNFGTKARFTCEMRADAVTLGDVFSSAGYRCGIVGPWHLGRDHVPQHGFDTWETYNYQGEGRANRLWEYFDSAGVPNLYEKKPRRFFPGSGSGKVSQKMVYRVLEDPRQQRTTWTIDRGLHFLPGPAPSAPFFLFLSIKDPHPPIVVPPELLALYPPQRIPMPEHWEDPLAGKPDWQKNAPERLSDWKDPAAIRELIAHYFALMTHVDAQIGRLLRELEARGLRDDTIVAFISDHGEMLGEHGFLGKRMFYEPAVKVPCIVSWPAEIPAGGRYAMPIAGVDLAPTLAELAGLTLPAPIDGISLASELRSGREPAARAVLAELATHEVHTGITDQPEGLGGHIFVRFGDWKYVWSQFDSDELYHLSNDPCELDNLAMIPEYAGQVGFLRSVIQQRLLETGPGVYAWCLERAAA